MGARRGGGFLPVPVAGLAPQPPPPVPPGVVRGPWRLPAGRRGRAFSPPWPLVPPPVFVPGFLRARYRIGVLPARPLIAQVWPALTPAIPPPPAHLSSAAAALVSLRSGSVGGPPAEATVRASAI
ncbi:hypothetical protein N5079_19780 [Planotetraspora sp. A-T 1434]|uniref:hypothetical protein n=1 Tax=Planotetraspora sp. A-T 1434 TaxID=2979219 RepID=UPI0021C0AAF2|nr:hypothetical protein [Planotetraspora sp. A-T 1434]MCT9932445.1 hypothetical protein [Planotetraspora sp. A-T 1434]